MINVLLIDTKIAIDLQENGIPSGLDERTARPLALSIFSWIELEGGVYARHNEVELRQQRLRVVLRTMTILPFDPAVISAYAAIVATMGFSRRQLMDRLIAATAIVHDLPLATLNPDDFRAIPNLRLEVWPPQ